MLDLILFINEYFCMYFITRWGWGDKLVEYLSSDKKPDCSVDKVFGLMDTF